EPLFAELEFRTLGKRVFGEDFSILEKNSPLNGQMDLFAVQTTTVTTTTAIAIEVSNENIVLKNIHNTAHEYTLIDMTEEQEKLAKELAAKESFCFDTETTGLDANLADVVGLSFSFETGKAYYIPTPANR